MKRSPDERHKKRPKEHTHTHTSMAYETRRFTQPREDNWVVT